VRMPTATNSEARILTVLTPVVPLFARRSMARQHAIR